MDNSPTRDIAGDGSLLSSVIAEYIDEAERLDEAARQHLRDTYLQAHPELADVLKSHFEATIAWVFRTSPTRRS